MPSYTVLCTDQSDRHCQREIPFFLDIEGLDEDQLHELQEDGGTKLTEEQVKLNDLMADLNPRQKQQLARDKVVWWEEDIPYVCSACGSDQVHDDEGTNVTAL